MIYVNVKNKKTYMSGIRFKKNSRNILGFAWSKNKGDYWYDKDPSTAKFFAIMKSTIDDGKVAIRGIYIGRLAIFILSTAKVDV